MRLRTGRFPSARGLPSSPSPERFVFPKRAVRSEAACHSQPARARPARTPILPGLEGSASESKEESNMTFTAWQVTGYADTNGSRLLRHLSELFSDHLRLGARHVVCLKRPTQGARRDQPKAGHRDQPTEGRGAPRRDQIPSSGRYPRFRICRKPLRWST